MDIKEIQNLIKFVAKSGASEVSLETEDFKITIKTPYGAAPEFPTTQMVPMIQSAPQVVEVSTTAPAAPAPAPAADDSQYITIKSPMIGTFYRRPSPDKPTFVDVGSEISSGSVVCVIEAMKLFNEIESEIAGKIVKVLVEDQTPVEYDQPLFLVEPA